MLIIFVLYGPLKINFKSAICLRMRKRYNFTHSLVKYQVSGDLCGKYNPAHPRFKRSSYLRPASICILCLLYRIFALITSQIDDMDQFCSLW